MATVFVLSDHVYSSYSQYKRKGEELCLHVQQEAIAHGHRFNMNNSPAQTNTNNRGINATNDLPRNPLSQSTTAVCRILDDLAAEGFRLYIHQLAAPLRTIVESGRVRQFDIGMADRIRDIISKRKQCAAFYQRLTGSSDSQHQYVIAQLKEYVQILQPIWPKAIPMNFHVANEVNNQTEYIEFANRFLHLELSQRTETERTATQQKHGIFQTVASETNTKAMNSFQTKDFDMKDEDLLFARSSLLTDFKKLEHVLIQVFCGVVVGSQRVNVAVLILDLATRSAISLEMETSATKKDHTGVLVWPVSFFAKLARTSNGIVVDPHMRFHETVFDALKATKKRNKKKKKANAFTQNGEDGMYNDYFKLGHDEQQVLEAKHSNRLLAAARTNDPTSLPHHNSQLVSLIRKAIADSDRINSPRDVSNGLAICGQNGSSSCCNLSLVLKQSAQRPA